jgi:hypothetical protein
MISARFTYDGGHSHRYALRFSALAHLFLRVLPFPLPHGREARLEIAVDL